MTKTYIISRVTSHVNGELTVRFSLYRRILEDGTDLGWNYSIGRNPIDSECGLFTDRDETRRKLVNRAIESGINEMDIDYCY